MANKLKTRLVTSGVLFSMPLLPQAFENTHGYIDPGTGSLIIQGLIAGIIGGVFLVKVFWRRITAFLSNLFSRAKKGSG